MFPSSDLGSFSAAIPSYVAISAVVVALAWRSLRRWLPVDSALTRLIAPRSVTLAAR